MKFGISTACFYPMLTEEALEAELELGFKSFEIFVNSFSEIEKPFMSKAKELLNNGNGEVVSLHPFLSGDEPFLLFSNYYRRFEDTLKIYDKFFNCAAFWGAKYVILHGARVAGMYKISDDEYFERFAILAERANTFGVTLLQENVNAFRSQSVDFIKKMQAALGDVARFNLDIKQTVRAGENVKDMCLAMGSGMCNIHINDHNELQDCILPGEGSMDYEEFFGLLRQIGYDGACLIEVYSKSYERKEQLVGAYEYLKSIYEK